MVRRLFVTSDILRILGIEPQMGRYFTHSDDRPGTPKTVVITYGYWQRRFGGNPSVIGQSLTIDGQQWDTVPTEVQTLKIQIPESALRDVNSPLAGSKKS